MQITSQFLKQSYKKEGELNIFDEAPSKVRNIILKKITYARNINFHIK